MIRVIISKCIKTDTRIASDDWNRQEVCDCKNCEDYFKLLRADKGFK